VADSDALVRGYAQAFFRIAEAEGESEAVEGQLYAFGTLLEREARVRDALADPSLPAENKRGLIRDTLGERANPVAANLLAFVVEQGHARLIGRVIEALTQVAAEERRHAVAEVRSAVALDEAQRRRLAEALSAATGRPVDVRVVVDPSILGGVVARIGNLIFDGSVRSRLDEAKQRLVARN
jgi:F-type H+-transporting ATPase subunit delta